jgi:Tol biopolymer transport system component
VFLADTDTGEIKELADLGSISSNAFIGIGYREIKVSPDGKTFAVGAMDGTDIYAMDGRLIRENVLPFVPNDSSTIDYPSLFWLPDSSGLIVATPDTIYSTESCDLPAHTLWRYLIETNAATPIALELPPAMDTFEVSPDGNWVVYGGYCEPSLYLGNLINGQTKIFGEGMRNLQFFWSPDSKRVMLGQRRVTTSFYKPPVSIEGYSPQWVDANHFISIERNYLIGEIAGDEIVYYDSGISYLDVILAMKPKP